jgi:hypothetical protein
MPKWARELRPTHGNPTKANQRRDAHRMVPTMQDLIDLPPAEAGVFMMTEQEIKRKRSQLYALNKDNYFGWRWRTLVEPGRGRYHQFLVWRIH